LGNLAPIGIDEEVITMTQNKVLFLKTGSSHIPEFAGKAENLRSFINALKLVDSIRNLCINSIPTHKNRT